MYSNTIHHNTSRTVPLDLLLVHDGQVLMSETVTDTSGGIVLTHSVIDEGYYQCFARNDVGCEQWTTFALRGIPLSAHTCTPPSIKFVPRSPSNKH